MTDHALVETRGLGVRFPGATRDVLRDISLTIGQGERIGIIGPSGCGKSTFALILAGAIPALLPGTISGELHWRDAAAGRRVAHVQQDIEAQLVALSVESEIAFALENRGLAPALIDRRITRALAEGPALGLRARDETLTLSTGWRQRLALAAALAEEAALTILDEPTAHLDERAAEDAIAFLSDGATGALVTIEHRVDLLARRVDRLLVLDRDGTPLAFAEPARALGTVAARPDLGLRLPLAVQAALALRRQGYWRLADLPVDGHALCSGLGQHAANPEAIACIRAAIAPVSGVANVIGAPVLSLENAGLKRGRRGVLHDITLTLRQGEIVGIAGANGSGKTSLALLVAGALRTSAGARHAAAGLHVQYVPQNPALVFASASLALEAQRRGLEWRDAVKAFEHFGLTADPGRHPLEHSQGELRRIALALALAGSRAGLAVLDEPTAGLDAGGLTALHRRLRERSACGASALIVSHDLDWLALTCDRIVVVKEGRIVANDTPSTIQQEALRGRLPIPPPPTLALLGALTEAGGHA